VVPPPAPQKALLRQVKLQKLSHKMSVEIIPLKLVILL
jgi:hypothetical protein